MAEREYITMVRLPWSEYSIDLGVLTVIVKRGLAETRRVRAQLSDDDAGTFREVRTAVHGSELLDWLEQRDLLDKPQQIGYDGCS